MKRRRVQLKINVRGALAETRKVLARGPMLLWSLFLIFFPFYVGPSGLPQPADCLIIILLPMLLARWNGNMLDMGRTFKVLLLFTAYAILLNLMWSFALGAFSINLKQGFLLSPTFYIYNSLLLFCFVLLYQRYGIWFLWVTMRVTLLSVALQVAISFMVSGYGLRASLLFNNPNQLGYYALLCACLLLLGMKRLQMSTLSVTLGLTGCCYLALMSASKAALGSIALLGIALLFSRLRTMIIATVVLAVLALTSNPFSRALEKAQFRIENDQSHGLLEERGYDRVIEHPEYWIFGSGEGDYQRFADTTVIGSHELHSSAATLFFSYGIIGLGLFGAFLWLALRGVSGRMFVILVPGFAYGMVHSGMRFALMWVMIGMAMALRHDMYRGPPKAAATPAVPTTPTPPATARPGRT
jgi:hypothetical protein